MNLNDAAKDIAYCLRPTMNWNDAAKDIAYCLRPTTLVAVIVDLEESSPSDVRRAMLNAAVRELVNNAGEAKARTMLAERGLVLVATFTVRQGQDSL